MLLAFLLLAIIRDESALRLALDAITSESSTERGTGLEYLDNLLPFSARSRVLALVEHPERALATFSWPVETVASIAARMRSKEISVEEARSEFRRFRRTEYDGHETSEL